MGHTGIHLFESEKFGDNTLLFKEGEAYLKAVVRESLRLQVETFVTKTLRPESRKRPIQKVCNATVKIIKTKTNSQILADVKKMTKIQISAAGPWQHQTAVCSSSAWKVSHFMEWLCFLHNCSLWSL